MRVNKCLLDSEQHIVTDVELQQLVGPARFPPLCASVPVSDVSCAPPSNASAKARELDGSRAWYETSAAWHGVWPSQLQSELLRDGDALLLKLKDELGRLAAELKPCPSVLLHKKMLNIDWRLADEPDRPLASTALQQTEKARSRKEAAAKEKPSVFQGLPALNEYPMPPLWSAANVLLADDVLLCLDPVGERHLKDCIPAPKATRWSKLNDVTMA
eukprot:1858323-Pleurochrysis_carterae.AAC.1